MKSVLIKDTTKSERIAIIKEWIPVDDGLEDCEIDMWEMYREYINGEKEIAQINEEFSKRMFGLGDEIIECLKSQIVTSRMCRRFRT